MLLTKDTCTLPLCHPLRRPRSFPASTAYIGVGIHHISRDVLEAATAFHYLPSELCSADVLNPSRHALGSMRALYLSLVLAKRSIYSTSSFR